MKNVAAAIGRSASGKLPTSTAAFTAYEKRVKSMAPMPSRSKLDEVRTVAVQALPRPQIIPNARPEDLIVGYVPEVISRSAAEMQLIAAGPYAHAPDYGAGSSNYHASSQPRAVDSFYHGSAQRQYASPRAVALSTQSAPPPAFDRSSFGDASRYRSSYQSNSARDDATRAAAAAPMSNSSNYASQHRSGSGVLDRRMAPSLTRDYDDDDVYYVGQVAPQHYGNDRRFATPTGGGSMTSSSYRRDESYGGGRPRSPPAASGMVNTPRYAHHVY